MMLMIRTLKKHDAYDKDPYILVICKCTQFNLSWAGEEHNSYTFNFLLKEKVLEHCYQAKDKEFQTWALSNLILDSLTFCRTVN